MWADARSCQAHRCRAEISSRASGRSAFFSRRGGVRLRHASATRAPAILRHGGQFHLRFDAGDIHDLTVGGTIAETVEVLHLADAGLTMDHHGPALAVPKVDKQLIERAWLLVAVDEGPAAPPRFGGPPLLHGHAVDLVRPRRTGHGARWPCRRQVPPFGISARLATSADHRLMRGDSNRTHNANGQRRPKGGRRQCHEKRRRSSC